MRNAKLERRLKTNDCYAQSISNIKNTTKKENDTFFYAIERLPLEMEGCRACECLESQPVAHDCA